MKIKVWYSCEVCGAKKEEALIRPRRTREDLKHYMERIVIFAVGHTHRQKHPDCPARKLKDLILPIPKNAKKFGDPDADYSGYQEPPKDLQRGQGL